MAHELDNIHTRRIYPAAHDLKLLLPDNWWQGEDNPNTFFSDQLQCIYVYDKHIKYWEDLRADVVVRLDLPLSYHRIFKLITEHK